MNRPARKTLPRFVCMTAAFVALAWYAAWAVGGPVARSSADTQLSPQPLSVAGQASLRALIASGNFADLRWPDFSDYRGLVGQFYDSENYALPWIRGGKPTAQASQLISLLMQADDKGLDAEDYDGSRWAARLAKLAPATPQPSETDAMRTDLALTICAMRYISDLHIGKVNPEHFSFGISVQHKKYDLPNFLRADVVDAPEVATALATVEPAYPGYQRLLLALKKYRDLAAQETEQLLPAVSKTVAPGDTYAGLPQLAHFLWRVGDLPTAADPSTAGTVYQGPIVNAVKRFQERHGLTPDGRLGAGTIAALNVPLAQRLRQMELTLERWRWLPVWSSRSAIVVNIPEFRLRGFDEHLGLALTMNVVVGIALKHSTPIFIESMQYVVFRPYWNVPYSIAKAELLPAAERDPNYLAKKGFEVVDGRGNVAAGGAVTSEILQQVRAGKLFLRQKTGPNNSLGLVKFIFPNDYSIYMHDTPATEFFSRSRRDFSHGCVRLEKPAELAVWVLRNNPGWDMERVRAAMNGSAGNVQVNLERPIPVLILYATVVAEENGEVHFFDDIYGHDKSLDKVLRKGYPYPG